jgi:hypothetical protein
VIVMVPTFNIEEIRRNVREWIADLRSGKFEQGFHAMHTHDDGHCCLGVAGCSLERILDIPVNRFDYFRVQQAMGLADDLGHFNGGSLYEMNDKARRPFDAIADFIEKNLNDNRDGLFIDGVAEGRPL